MQTLLHFFLEGRGAGGGWGDFSTSTPKVIRFFSVRSCFLGVDVLNFIIPLKMTICFIICISGIHWQVIMFNSRLYPFVCRQPR